MAASKITPTAVNFMAKHGRGLICAPITEERAMQLGFSEWSLTTARCIRRTLLSPSMPPEASRQDQTHGIAQ